MTSCCRCKQVLDSTCFQKDISRYNGLSSRCKPCSSEYKKQWHKKHRTRVLEDRKLYRKAVSAQVYAAYGNKCNCCGEANPIFFDIDHINNDGAAQSKALHGGANFHLWIIKNNFPSNLQILCCNCNNGKARNKGICPHQATPTKSE